MRLRNTAKRALLSPFAVFRGPARDNRIALTFDDGPNPRYTPAVSRLLRQAGVGATFFVVGDMVRKHPDLAQGLLEDGHEIANHSMSHPEIRDLPYARFGEEIEEVYRLALPDGAPLLRNRYLRPPKGVVTLRLLYFCLRRRIRLVFWSRDPEDFRASSAHDILRYFDAHPPQAGDIVLLHDKTPHIVAALPGLLRRLEDLTLRPVTLSRLLERPS